MVISIREASLTHPAEQLLRVVLDCLVVSLRVRNVSTACVDPFLVRPIGRQAKPPACRPSHLPIEFVLARNNRYAVVRPPSPNLDERRESSAHLGFGRHHPFPQPHAGTGSKDGATFRSETFPLEQIRSVGPVGSAAPVRVEAQTIDVASRVPPLARHAACSRGSRTRNPFRRPSQPSRPRACELSRGTSSHEGAPAEDQVPRGLRSGAKGPSVSFRAERRKSDTSPPLH